ncbi:hypothetical protein FY557_15975 [Chryseobacterium sp. SN22]|uniref:hypothetical protein n=1 Tax=Chryseobacterium sp. SN22 TaxID=2606431 RepID=UPI0011EFEA1B|nr:hypothetical protein [Chryseobacterium sp. SN22]KAA0126799.1 hypothetical protein FY557_15975 [Chryseobacterium sp. SN22]
MELEFKSLQEFNRLKIKLQKGDYLYQHDKPNYPLRNEVDISNLYFVTEIRFDNLEIHSMAKNKILTVKLDELAGSWWIMKIPTLIREKLGLEG